MADGVLTFPWRTGGTYTLTPVTITTRAGSFINYAQSWTPAPVAATPAPAPVVAPVIDNNYSAATYGKVIPESAGERRLPGDTIWLKGGALNTDGSFTATAAFCFGRALRLGVSASLARMWANGTEIYDASTGVTADGVTFTFYDGTQTTADPQILADKGADRTPAYMGLLYVVVSMNTREFNGTLPNISGLIRDDGAGSLFGAWGGTWNPLDKASDITLSGGDLIADSARITQASVRGTQARSSGKRTFGITANSVSGGGYGIAISDASSSLDFFLGSQPPTTSFRWAANGLLYQNGVAAGSWVSYTNGDDVALYVDVDNRVLWGSKDGVNFYGLGAGPHTAADVIAGVGGFDFSAITGAIYPAVTLAVDADQATGNFDDPAFLAEVGVSESLLFQELNEAVARRCYMTGASFRYVDTADLPIVGEVITSNTDYKSWLRNKGRIKSYDFTESGSELLIARPIVGTTYTTAYAIPATDFMPLSADGSTETIRSDEQTVAAIYELSYIDTSIDYQLSTQRYRREELFSTLTDSFAVSEVMDASDALSAIATAGNKEWQQRITHRFRLGPKYLRLEPIDIVTFTSGSKAYTAKVTQVTKNPDLSIDVMAVNLFTAENISLLGFGGDPNIGGLPFEVADGGPDFSKRVNSAFAALFEDI